MLWISLLSFLYLFPLFALAAVYAFTGAKYPRFFKPASICFAALCNFYYGMNLWYDKWQTVLLILVPVFVGCFLGPRFKPVYSYLATVYGGFCTVEAVNMLTGSSIKPIWYWSMLALSLLVTGLFTWLMEGYSVLIFTALGGSCLSAVFFTLFSSQFLSSSDFNLIAFGVCLAIMALASLGTQFLLGTYKSTELQRNSSAV